MNKEPRQALLTEEIDPERAIDATVVTNEAEVVLIFSRHVLKQKAEGFVQQPVLSAAVSIPWQAAIGLRAALDQMIEQRRGVSSVDVATAPLPVPTRPN